MDRVQMRRVVDGKRYDTETATLIAHDVYWDGHNHERHGRNAWLYRTKRGAYFVVSGTFWQGERDSLDVVSEAEARELYEGALSEHEVSYEAAFPGVVVEEA